MTCIDIRLDNESGIDEIRFANAYNVDAQTSQGSVVTKNSSCKQVLIYEGDDEDSVRINSRQHAEDLIKALRKAIQLGWLE